MPAFVDTAVKDIDGRLRELHDEVSRLEAARSALTGERRRPGRPRGTTSRTTRSRTTRARTARRSASTTTGARTPRRSASTAPRARSPRRGGNTRAAQTLELVRERPGITVAQIAAAMKIEPNYLYRVLPRLESDGQVKRDAQVWHPAK